VDRSGRKKSLMNMDKRRVSVLIPYLRRDGGTFVFLQKRSKDALRSPGFFGFFGGGIEEGETPDEALCREIREELTFDLDAYVPFKNFESDHNILYVFTLEVDEGFERRITIVEGEYGKWFGEREAMDEPQLSDNDKLVLREWYDARKMPI
jgi:8-oxo-dGTP diphosphatase